MGVGMRLKSCMMCWMALAALSTTSAMAERQRDSATRTLTCEIGVIVEAEPTMPLMLLRDDLRKGRREAVLTDDWLYHYKKDGRVFLVPAGYTTDFASIPMIARLVADQYGKHAEAAVVHDWLYAVGYKDPSTKDSTREDADEILLYAMEEQNVSWLTRSTIFRAVRLFGAKPFGSEKEWQDNWTVVDRARVGTRTGPPIAKPEPSHIATVSEAEFNEGETRERLKFLHGTQPDACSKLSIESQEVADGEIARQLYIGCFIRSGYKGYLEGVENAGQCRNKANLACKYQFWDPSRRIEFGFPD